MTITEELKYIKKVQNRCIKLCKYLEKQDGKYNNLYRKISYIVGTIEEALTFDEE